MRAMLHTQFETYVLERKLGGGGMGDVYLAATADRRRVALKLIEFRDDADSRDIVGAERVGAKLQQRFSSSDPHVPAVFRIDEADGYFFIEMEYVDGRDLAELIAAGLDPKAAVEIAIEVACFLERAHEFTAEVEGREYRGIVHADLKPKNIRISTRDEVKVLDFGISKGLSLTGRLTTAAFGSRSYMSPEWVDTGRLDRHVDYWALGVVLYEMLAGRLPFQTENARQLELLLRARTPPLPLPASVPLGLQRVVLKALAPTIEKRYGSASDFRADLEAWLSGAITIAEREWISEREGDVTRRTGTSERAATPDDGATRRTGTAPATGTAPGEAGSEATRRTRWDVPPPPVPALAGVPGVPAATDPNGPAAPAAGSDVLPAAPATTSRLSRWRSRVTVRRVALAIVALVLMNEYSACRKANALRGELPARDDSSLQEVWDEYRGIRDQSLLGFAKARVSDPVRDLLLSHADRVIADYRRESPAVRERNWEQARNWLANALQIDPGDRDLLARLRYCEGQLARINGEARLRERKPQLAARPLHDAVDRFEEATELNRTWPDPWLGLFRVYAYGLEDVDQATQALNQAERRGYKAGRREFAQLGDLHLAKAEGTRKDCDVLPDDQVCKCLSRAGESFSSAATWFGRAEGFGDTSRSVARAHEGLQRVTQLRWEMACPDAEPPEEMKR